MGHRSGRGGGARSADRRPPLFVLQSKKVLDLLISDSRFLVSQSALSHTPVSSLACRSPFRTQAEHAGLRHASPTTATASSVQVQLNTQRWVLMDVCGGQTHNLVRSGIESALQDVLELIHGPGCPVCVTPSQVIHFAIALSHRPNTILTSFGDMLRVPGSSKDLFMVKSEGGDVRMVYSPLEAVNIARENPDREVVFLAVGFETTGLWAATSAASP